MSTSASDIGRWALSETNGSLCSMITTDELLFEAVSRGLQATFEALNDLTRDLSEPRKKQIYAKTERVQRARAHIDALLDERRADLEFGP